MDINQFLVHTVGHITFDIYRRNLQAGGPWLNLPKKVAFPEGVGETITNIMWERPYVVPSADGIEWGDNDSAMGVNVNSGNSCIPSEDEVRFAETRRETRLFHKALNSPMFCVTDLLYAGKRESQMMSIEKNLAEVTRYYWVKWNRDGYRRLARKYVANAGMIAGETDESNGSAFTEAAATSDLTNGILDYIYGILTLEEGQRHQLSMQNGRPVYGLITDQLTSRALIRANDTIREDFRYAKPDALLMPLGVSHTYNGFIHMMDLMPDRYNYDAGAANGSKWVWINPWVEEDLAKGPPVNGADAQQLRKVNPAWITAEAQDSFIYVKDAYQCRVPNSLSNVSKAKYEAQKYMGEYKFQNVINLDPDSDYHNPDGKLGRFRGVLAAGIEAINPHVMFVVRHKVCQAELGLLDCAGEPLD